MRHTLVVLSLTLPRAGFAILLAVGSAQAADAVTFLRMIRDLGPAAEANPLVAHAASMGELGPLIAAKAGVVALVIIVFGLLSRRHGRTGGLVASVAVAAGFIGAFSNLAVIAAAAARLAG